jgi:hypothetical protein
MFSRVRSVAERIIAQDPTKLIYLSAGVGCGVGACYLRNKYKPVPQFELMAVDDCGSRKRFIIRENYRWSYYDTNAYKNTTPRPLVVDYKETP